MLALILRYNNPALLVLIFYCYCCPRARSGFPFAQSIEDRLNAGVPLEYLQLESARCRVGTGRSELVPEKEGYLLDGW